MSSEPLSTEAPLQEMSEKETTANDQKVLEEHVEPKDVEMSQGGAAAGAAEGAEEEEEDRLLPIEDEAVYYMDQEVTQAPELASGSEMVTVQLVDQEGNHPLTSLLPLFHDYEKDLVIICRWETFKPGLFFGHFETKLKPKSILNPLRQK